LTKELFAFGEDLSIYNAIYVILGVYPYNHILTSEHGVKLHQYVYGGGNLYLEGSDCYNYDPDNGGMNIRIWFSLNPGPDGENDVFFVKGLDQLDTVSFSYSGLNYYMDELIPVNSTPILKNPENDDILGVWWDGFGTAHTIGVVPSYGGLVDTTGTGFKEYLMCRYLNYFGYDYDCESVITGIASTPPEHHGIRFSVSPNPTTGPVHIQLIIPDNRQPNLNGTEAEQYLTCDLFEISGLRIKQLINEIKNPGTYDIAVDLSELAPGVYFCTLKTGKGMQTKKLIKLE
jgi:hypothetical protein